MYGKKGSSKLSQSRKGGRRPLEESARYKAYLVLIEYAKTHHGNSPSERELAKLMRDDVGYSTVRGYLRGLELDGVIRKQDGRIIIVNAEWTPPGE